MHPDCRFTPRGGLPNKKGKAQIMKRLFFVGVLVLAGCANSNQRLSDQPKYNSDGSRSYSQETQQKTGEQTPAEALSKEDAAVSVSHH